MKNNSYQKPSYKPLPLFWMGASASFASSLAEIISIPLDTVKVRLQLQTSGIIKNKNPYQGSINTIIRIIKEEGLLAPWAGLVPGIHRQIIFSFIRIGFYDIVRDFVTPKKNKQNPTLFNRILAGLITGSGGILIASPTDVVKVRMQAQGQPGATKIYKGVFNAYYKILQTQGINGFYSGIVPNMMRNAVINAAELATFDQLKTFLLSHHLMKDNIICHFICSALAGFTGAVVGSPVDVLKTRIINSNSKENLLKFVYKIIKNEGFGAFYKGFAAGANRIITWNISMFIILQQTRSFLQQKLNKQY